MTVDIEQRVDDLLKHTGVWDETKETLRELLVEHKAGTLDADDAKYIEGLHKKMFRDEKAAVEMFVGAGPLPQAHNQRHAILVRQPQVHDQRIVPALHGHALGCPRVRRGIHVVSRFCQCVAQERLYFEIVFH